MTYPGINALGNGFNGFGTTLNGTGNLGNGRYGVPFGHQFPNPFNTQFAGLPFVNSQFGFQNQFPQVPQFPQAWGFNGFPGIPNNNWSGFNAPVNSQWNGWNTPIVNGFQNGFQAPFANWNTNWNTGFNGFNGFPGLTNTGFNGFGWNWNNAWNANTPFFGGQAFGPTSFNNPASIPTNNHAWNTNWNTGFVPGVNAVQGQGFSPFVNPFFSPLSNQGVQGMNQGFNGSGVFPGFWNNFPGFTPFFNNMNGFTQSAGANNTTETGTAGIGIASEAA